MNLLLVALGGSLGAVARYTVGTWLTDPNAGPVLPWGTITANLIGCVVIGVVFGLGQASEGLGDGVRLLVVVGFLGGFTTFSAFGLETATLMRLGHTGLAFSNVGLQVVGGLAGVMVGLWAGAKLAG